MSVIVLNPPLSLSLSLTGRVSLPSTMKEVIQVVRDTVARQQKSVIWEMEGDQRGSAMDLST